MSREAAIAFLDRLKEDAAFRERVLAEQDIAARMAMINDAGFDCTLEEIKSVPEVMDDQQLEAVAAAGFGWWDKCCIA